MKNSSEGTGRSYTPCLESVVHCFMTVAVHYISTAPQVIALHWFGFFQPRRRRRRRRKILFDNIHISGLQSKGTGISLETPIGQEGMGPAIPGVKLLSSKSVPVKSGPDCYDGTTICLHSNVKTYGTLVKKGERATFSLVRLSQLKQIDKLNKWQKGKKGKKPNKTR